ncbi:MAG: hypothetical protein ACRC2T_08575 [Thermoguttaceae bacterium]
MSRKKAFYLIVVTLSLLLSTFYCVSESAENTEAKLIRNFTQEDEQQVTSLLLQGDYETVIRIVPNLSDINEDIKRDKHCLAIISRKMVAYVMLDDPENALELVDYLIASVDTDAPNSDEEKAILLVNRGFLHCLCDNYGLAIKSFLSAQKILNEREDTTRTEPLKIIIHLALLNLYIATEKNDKILEEAKLVKSIIPKAIAKFKVLGLPESPRIIDDVIEGIESGKKVYAFRLSAPQDPPKGTDEGEVIFFPSVQWYYVVIPPKETESKN